MTFVLSLPKKSRRINSYLKERIYIYIRCTVHGNEHDDRHLYGKKND